MKAIHTFSRAVVLFLAIIFAGCEGEKELVIIEGNLPLKTSTLYMVGDATPAGWDINNPTPFTPTQSDPLIFVYEGSLNAGELKCCLTPGSWDVSFIHPLTAGCEISKGGVHAESFQLYAGGEDLKWKVTDAGRYNLTFDLRNWTMTAAWLGE